MMLPQRGEGCELRPYQVGGHSLWSVWAGSHRVLPLELQLVDGQSLGVFQLLDLLHLLVVASDLLVDHQLHAPEAQDGV